MKPNLSLEVAGQQRIFTPETTEVHLYRVFNDTVFNHVVSEEYESQRVYLFNVPNLLCFLSGAEVIGHNLGKKELKVVTAEMDKQVGWNAKTIIIDEAPEEVKERYIKLSTAVLRQEVVVVPSSWS